MRRNARRSPKGIPFCSKASHSFNSLLIFIQLSHLCRYKEGNGVLFQIESLPRLAISSGNGRSGQRPVETGGERAAEEVRRPRTHHRQRPLLESAPVVQHEDRSE